MKIGEKYKARNGQIVTITRVHYTGTTEDTITLYDENLKPVGNDERQECEWDLMERVEWRQK